MKLDNYQNEYKAKKAIGEALDLENIVDAIVANLNVREVWPEDELKDWATDNGYIHEDEMDQWAKDNGYTKAEEA